MGRKRKLAGQLLGSPHAAAFSFLAEEKRCSGLALLSSLERGFHFGFSKQQHESPRLGSAQLRAVRGSVTERVEGGD